MRAAPPLASRQESWVLAHEGLHGYLHEHSDEVLEEYDQMPPSKAPRSR